MRRVPRPTAGPPSASDPVVDPYSLPAPHGSLATMLAHWAATTGDRPAIGIVDGPAHTFASWQRRSGSVAHRFGEVGVGAGDLVAFLGKSAVTWGEVLLGASAVRAAGVPLNWRLSRREMNELLDDAKPKLVVAEPEFLPLLDIDDPGDARTRVVIDGSVLDYQAWVDDAPPLDTAPDPRPEDVALVVYTSGTSGRPKGVELPNRAIAANLASPAPWNIRPGDTVMVPAPLFHVSGTGWLFYCLGLGANSLYVTDIVPGKVLDVLGSGRVDHALTVPAIVRMLLDHPTAHTHGYPQLRTLIYGGSPMSPDTAREAMDVFGCDLVQSYGMTETCGPITFLTPDDHRRGGPILAAAGRAVAGVELRVADPLDGTECPPGQIGEVWTRSDLIMAGYRNAPAESASVLRADGWFRTGDAGHLDEDGYLFLRDRIKDMIVTGGENVYPIEVETVLAEHPQVIDAAVIGVPHDKWGETVKAIVVAGGDVDTDELREFCRARLAHYKCPTSIDMVDQLPRNPSGKILKRELRRQYWADHDRSIA